MGVVRTAEQEGLSISTRTGHTPDRSVRVPINLDAADNVDRSPQGAQREAAACQVAKEATNTGGQASLLLDNCLARAASLCEKLDRLSMKASGQSRTEEAERAGTTQSTNKPGVILDTCLARASSLHGKLDKLSTLVSPRGESGQLTRAEDKSIPQSVRSEDVWPAQYPGLPASTTSL